MTELLDPVLRRGSAGPDRTRRPLALNAALAGLAAPAVALLLGWAVGLVAWFSSDGGSHGTTRSVLRLAADTWLLAHGAHLDLGEVVVTASPLGLTLACGWLAYRSGRWAGAASDVDDLRTAGLGTVVLAGTYGLVALAVAVLASTSDAAPGLILSFLGAAALAGAAGGVGLLRGAALLGPLRSAVPASVRSVGYAALVVVLGMVAAGAALVSVAAAVRGPAVANVAEGLHLDAVGLLFSLLLTVALAPNAALLAGSYLLGPGFAVGMDTVVSPQEVTLGAVPLVPVLGALPPEGWSPGWLGLLLAVPLAVGAVAGVVAVRLAPADSVVSAALRGAAGGALGAVVLATVTAQAGGSIGPGRMAETGAGFLPLLAVALLAFVPSAAVGAAVATWRQVAEPVGEPVTEPAATAEPAEPAASAEPTGPTATAEPAGQPAPVRLPAQRGPARQPVADEEETVRVEVPRGPAPPEG